MEAKAEYNVEKNRFPDKLPSQFILYMYTFNCISVMFMLHAPESPVKLLFHMCNLSVIMSM